MDLHREDVATHRFVETHHFYGAERVPPSFTPPAGGVLVRSDYDRTYQGNVINLLWLVPLDGGHIGRSDGDG